MLFVNVQALYLTASRLGHLVLGARQAAGRRRDMMLHEMRSQREAEAYILANVKGMERWRQPFK